MVRTQIQLTPEQTRALKRMATREGVSVAELVRRSVDILLKKGNLPDSDDLRGRALGAVGRLKGEEDLAEHHDDYLVGAFEE